MKTKHHAIVFFALIFSVTLSAQDFQGMATYKSARKVDLKMDDSSANSEMKKQIEEQLKNSFNGNTH